MPKKQRGQISFETNQVTTDNPVNLGSLYTTEFASLTPDKIKFYIEAARKGLNFWKALLFDEIRRKDLHIGSVCQTRKLQVVGKSWQLTLENDNPDLTDFVKTNLAQKYFTNFLTDIVEASISGVSVFEINYQLESNRVMIDNINLVPSHVILYNDIENKYEFLDVKSNDAFLLRMLSSNSYIDRINTSSIKKLEIAVEKILEVHSLDGNAANGFQNGCIDALIWAYLNKNFALKDYAIYLEKHADPPVVGKYDSLMGDVQRQAMERAVQNFGRSKWILLPKDLTEFDILDRSQKAATSSLFTDFLREWEDGISMRVLGQTLTTQIGDKGSFAAAQVHNMVRRDIEAADLMLIETTVNELIRRIVDLNFDSVSEYPKFSFMQQADINYQTGRAEIIKSLYEAGWKTEQENIEKEFELKVSAQEPKQPAGQFSDAIEFADKFLSKKKKSGLLDEYVNQIWESSSKK